MVFQPREGTSATTHSAEVHSENAIAGETNQLTENRLNSISMVTSAKFVKFSMTISSKDVHPLLKTKRHKTALLKAKRNKSDTVFLCYTYKE